MQTCTHSYSVCGLLVSIAHSSALVASHGTKAWNWVFGCFIDVHADSTYNLLSNLYAVCSLWRCLLYSTFDLQQCCSYQWYVILGIICHFYVEGW